MHRDEQKQKEHRVPGYETQIPREAEYYYATGMSHPQPKRTGLFVLMTLLAIMLCAAVALLMSLRLQLARSEDGKVALYVTDREAEAQPEAAPAEEQTQNIAIPAPQVQTNTGATLQIARDTAGAVMSLQQIYQKVLPSVVSIVNLGQMGESTGTGIIMSADGYILTNFHVIQNNVSLQVLLQDDSVYQAALVGCDETSDLAVLKIDAEGLTPAEFGDSDTLQVGDTVVTIGDPLGTQLRGTMTDGIISGINRDLVIDGRGMTLIQTNAALNSGNSGGPLINMQGQVIGINTMKMSSAFTSASVEGLGFAIPISVAKDIVDELLAKGYVAGRPAIGITGESVPVTARTYYQLPAGVYVSGVEETSDAWRAGIRPGDIITAIEGTDIASVEELNTVKNRFEAGQTITLVVYRDGSHYQVDITLMDAAGVTQ